MLRSLASAAVVALGMREMDPDVVLFRTIEGIVVAVLLGVAGTLVLTL